MLSILFSKKFYFVLCSIFFLAGYFIKFGNFHSFSTELTFIFFLLFIVMSLLNLKKKLFSKFKLVSEDFIVLSISLCSLLFLSLKDINLDSVNYIILISFSSIYYFLLRLILIDFNHPEFFGYLRISVIIAFIVGILHALFFVPLDQLLVSTRLGGDIVNPVGLAGILFTLFAILLASLSFQKKISISGYLFSGLILITIFLTGSRASMIASLLLIILISYFRNFTFGTVISILSLFLSFLYISNIDDAASRFTNLADSRSALARYDTWENVIYLINENYFTGIGLHGYQNLHNDYPHNLFLEIILSFGLLGLIIVTGIISYLSINLFIVINSNHIALRIFYLSILCLLLIKMLSFNLSHIRELFFFLAIYCTLRNQAPKIY